MNTEPEAVMHNFWVVAAAAVLVCGEALAAEGPAPENGEAAVGVGVLCNTSKQAEQFVSLRGKGAAPEKAMQAVNSVLRVTGMRAASLLLPTSETGPSAP